MIFTFKFITLVVRRVPIHTSFASRSLTDRLLPSLISTVGSGGIDRGSTPLNRYCIAAWASAGTTLRKMGNSTAQLMEPQQAHSTV